MAVSAKALQAQLEELATACPNLLPSVIPQGYQDGDLYGLAKLEGQAQHDALHEVISIASNSGNGYCSICSGSGQATASSDLEDDEASALRFTTFTRISFANKTLQFCRGTFACGRCRGLLDASRFVHYTAAKLGPAHADREQLAQQLCAHFALVNQAPEHILNNQDAVVMWAQEVFCRAYALQVIASNIFGWKVTGPDGEAVKCGVAGTSVELARKLLELEASEARISTKGRKGKKSSAKASIATLTDQEVPEPPAKKSKAEPGQQASANHTTVANDAKGIVAFKPKSKGKPPAAAATHGHDDHVPASGVPMHSSSKQGRTQRQAKAVLSEEAVAPSPAAAPVNMVKQATKRKGNSPTDASAVGGSGSSKKKERLDATAIFTQSPVPKKKKKPRQH